MKTIEVTNATMNEIREAKEYLKTKGRDVDESEIVATALQMVRMLTIPYSYESEETIVYALGGRWREEKNDNKNTIR